MFPTYIVLAWKPFLFAFLFYMFVMSVMFKKREAYQKVPFQVSHSAFFGFVSICLSFGIAGERLQDAAYVATLPKFLQVWWFHLACLVAGVAVGYMFQSAGHPGPMKEWKSNTEKADLTYALRLLPLIFYFFAVTVPVIFWDGSFWPMVLAVLCYVWFLMTFKYDVQHKLLDQTKVVQETAVTSVLDARRTAR